MAAAAGSLKSQALDLVQHVAVFKLGASGDALGVARTRSAHAATQPFHGVERRGVGRSSGPSARSGTATPGPAAPLPPLVAVVADQPTAPKAQPKVAAKAPAMAATGGKDDWESF